MLLVFLFIFLQDACLIGTTGVNSDEVSKRFEALELKQKLLEEEIADLRAKNSFCACPTKENERRLLLPNEDAIYKIAFDAVLSHNLDHSGLADTIIAYDRVLTNIGSAYHSDTGVFEAPVKGVYLFTYTIHGGAATDIWGSLAVNGNQMTSVQADGSAQSILVPTASRTTILSLNKDDRVYIQILKGSRGMLTSASHRHSSFAGVLLFPY